MPASLVKYYIIIIIIITCIQALVYNPALKYTWYMDK